MTGQKIGEWTVLRRDMTPNKYGKFPNWICRCSCGTEKPVSGISLRKGQSSACPGHYRKHPRGTYTPGSLYYVWSSMIARCYNKKHTSYPRYGGRGVVVCDEWRESYQTFVRDMGLRPEGKSLDRINNDGPYSKANCRWVDDYEQNANKRNSLIVECEGKKMALCEVARRYGVPYQKLYNQHRTQGYPLPQAIDRARNLASGI